jgi:ParB-like nuclease domain
MNLTDLKFHELSNTFPLIDEEQTLELADDIKKRGLIEPLVLYEEAILDGRNRYNAAKLAGYKLKPDDVVQFEEHYEGVDPVAFVISKNIRRRHLTIGQRAGVLSVLHKILKPREKQNAQNCANVPQKGLEQRAIESGISPHTARRAQTVLNADPKLHAQVVDGKVPLDKAVHQVRQRKAQQHKITGQEHDEALVRIKKICGVKFLDQIKEDQVHGLKTPKDLVAFAKLSDTTMKQLVDPLCLGWMTLAEARKFLDNRPDNHGELNPDYTWSAQEFAVLMQGEEKYQCTRVINTPRCKMVWTLRLKRPGEENEAKETGEE